MTDKVENLRNLLAYVESAQTVLDSADEVIGNIVDKATDLVAKFEVKVRDALAEEEAKAAPKEESVSPEKKISDADFDALLKRIFGGGGVKGWSKDGPFPGGSPWGNSTDKP